MVVSGRNPIQYMRRFNLDVITYPDGRYEPIKDFDKELTEIQEIFDKFIENTTSQIFSDLDLSQTILDKKVFLNIKLFFDCGYRNHEKLKNILQLRKLWEKIYDTKRGKVYKLKSKYDICYGYHKIDKEIGSRRYTQLDDYYITIKLEKEEL